MNKILYTLLAGAFVLTSCSKEAAEEPAARAEATTTFTLSVGELQTRGASAVTPSRYIMEVWSRDGGTAENVFDDAGTPSNRKEFSGGSITVALDKTKAYTCLFWADDNAAFNAASLKAVALNPGKEMTEAYHAKITVPEGNNPAMDVTLQRAVAKVTLTETAGVKSGESLAVNFTNIFPTFNVQDGTATGDAAGWAKTVRLTAGTGVIGTFYFFAKPGQELTELTFTYASEGEKTVSNVPYRQNYATNIKGEYSNLLAATFSVTADDDWGKPDNTVDLTAAQPGDYFYADGTWATAYINNPSNVCIGIVFEVNADGKSGKIVSLDEANATWATDGTTYATTATNEKDGTANMAVIKDLSNDYTNFPAFKWCADKTEGGLTWYLPAPHELQDLYAATCGLKIVDADPQDGEVKRWSIRAGGINYMTSADNYNTQRAAFKEKIIATGGQS